MMLNQTVQVNKRLKNELNPRHAEFTYDFPETVAEATEKYGEGLTLKLINDAITLAVQSPARKALEAADADLSPEQYSEIVANVMDGFKIELRRTRGPSTPKISAYQQMAQDLADPEKRDAIIAKFRSLGINLEMGGNEE